MIITRTPFRISFCGGSSDLPSFYEKHGGCVLSAAIDKYMYISIHPYFFESKTALKYSVTEIVDDVKLIRHKYFKQVLSDFEVSGVEITSTADAPAGTGLGSSSAFSVGLLHSIYSYKGKFVSRERLAREACELEIERLGKPIGKQDQYAAAFGGLNFMTFRQDGRVTVEPIIMPTCALGRLERNLMMFYTGYARDSLAILSEQKKNTDAGAVAESQLAMCRLAEKLREELQDGNADAMGGILHEAWKLKKGLAAGITNPEIDMWYKAAMDHGALGGKLLGAGGGGFLLFYVPEDKQEAVRRALPLAEFPFSFDWTGSSVIYVGDKNWK